MDKKLFDKLLTDYKNDLQSLEELKAEISADYTELSPQELTEKLQRDLDELKTALSND